MRAPAPSSAICGSAKTRLGGDAVDRPPGASWPVLPSVLLRAAELLDVGRGQALGGRNSGGHVRAAGHEPDFDATERSVLVARLHGLAALLLHVGGSTAESRLGG